MVWKENQVAICTGMVTRKNFYSYDLNWNGSKKVKEVKHDYKNVLGVLRYKKKEEKKTVITKWVTWFIFLFCLQVQKKMEMF